MDYILSRIKKWDDTCEGFVYWSIYHIAEAYKTLDRTTPVTLLDIGANVGKATDIMSSMIELKSSYLFEASPILYNYLAEKYKDNQNYKIFNCALTDQNTPSVLFAQEPLTDQLSPTYTSDYLNLGTSKILGNHTAIEVKNLKLSNFLNDNPHLFEENVIIKIDTENQDTFILKDLLTVLTSFKSAPLVEFEINHTNYNLPNSVLQEVVDSFIQTGRYKNLDILKSIEDNKGDEILVPL